MRSVGTLLAGLLVGAGLMLIPLPAAVAGGCDPGEVSAPAPSGVGTICVPAVDPGAPSGGGGGGDSGGGGPTTCQSNGEVIPCTTEFGVWFPSHACYAAPLDPQPAASDPDWGEHDPSEGTIYYCADGGIGGELPFFVANGAEPLPDPRELAQNALDQLTLETPDIKAAPAPPLATYVGLETWLWIPQTQWRDLSLTVSAGNTSVTVVAAPKRVDWDLTESTMSCYSPGREWLKGMSSTAKTTCSYTFSKLSDSHPDEKYPITATLVYAATWTCSGACTLPSGDLGDVPSLQGETVIEVNERQSVNKSRP